MQNLTRGSLVNPIRLVSGAVTLPAHAAAAAIGTSVGLATTGVRATARVVGRVVGQVSGSRSTPSAPWVADRPTPAEVDPVVDMAPAATKAPAKKAPAKKAPARKAAARKASSKQAAVLAPALGLTEAEVEAELHQPGTEPLMDPATAKAVASESEVLRRAADTDKG